MFKQLRDTIDWRRRNKTWMSEVDKAAAQPQYAARVKELKEKAGNRWWEFYWHWDEFQGAPSPKDYGFPDAYEAYLGDRLWETITTQAAHYFSLPEVKTGAYLGLYSSVRNFGQPVSLNQGLPSGTYRIRIRLGATDDAPPDRRFIELTTSGALSSHIGTYHVTGTIKEPQEIDILLRKSKSTPGGFAIREHRTNTGNARTFYDAEFKRNGVGPDYVIWIDWHEVEGPLVTPDNAAAIEAAQAIIARLLMSQAMRKLTGAIAKSKTTVIFINQIREKIGVMFGSPETTPGGRALKFYSSCRVDVRRIGQLKDGEDVVGQRVRVKIVKNKVAPPFRVAEFDMMHANGISVEGDILDLAVAAKLIDKTGTWMRFGETHLGQGREKARQFLKDNPAVAQEIREKVLASKEAMITVEAGERTTDSSDE
ncbi:MAG: hypothetical protein WCJ18_02985 [Planctomycetota bacterium]